MRTNLPITQTEYVLRDGAMLVSMTDPKGHITSVNEGFLEASGFSEAELIGKAHNIVRHPDMPEEAFADLWQTLAAGRPWTGLVKNRRKNGDHYWVLANVTPVREGAKITGHMSVRSKPSREQIAATEKWYQRFLQKRATGYSIREGRVVRAGVLARLSFHARLTLVQKSLWIGLLLALPVSVGLTALAFPARAADIPAGLAVLLGVCAAAGFLFGWRTMGRVSKVLRESAATVDELTQGNFEKIFEARSDDELGGMQRSLQSLRTKVGFELADNRRMAVENTRVRQALDAAATNVMVADTTGNIVYANRSLLQMFATAEGDIRQRLPQFSARDVVGANIDQYHANPAHQRGMLAELSGTHKTRLELGSRKLDLVINPIVERNGRRLGTVVEWSDRTQELRVESQLQEMLGAVLRGDLTARIDLQDKSGFFEVMSRGVNQLADNLAEIVGKVKVVVGDVYRGAQEISDGNSNLAQRTEEQSSSLEETAASMEEMTSAVRQTADNAETATRQADSARHQAVDGGAIVEQAVKSMADIRDASRRIGGIIGVVDEIAFQTNLLALNAAVEAARAGEQGRGFAVVASEVRQLAGRSAAAAREVKGLIQDSLTRVDGGSALVGQSGEKLQGIVESVTRVSQIVVDIATASREQSNGIEQVNRAVMQMDEITQQNAALVEEVTAASMSMATQVRELNELMDHYHLTAVGEHDVRVEVANSSAARPPTRKAGPGSSRGALNARSEVA